MAAASAALSASMSSMKDLPVSFGCHSFLNAQPLLYPLLNHYLSHNLNLVLDSPGMISQLLREKKLDLAIIPSIEYFRSRDYLLVPDLAIASLGKVDSVLLFSKKPWAALTRVAVDNSSRTSVAMLRIIFREQYHIDPLLIPMVAEISQMLQEAEAGLIIGDRALGAKPLTPYVYDLGEEWYKLTGKPFVHAVMALWPGRDLSNELRILREAQNLGLSLLPEIARAGAKYLGLDYQICLNYLQHKINYELGTAELEGLKYFADLAKKHDLIPYQDIYLRLYDGR
jgi:chorismate dehydratase